jgi:hypothetical protein
MGEAFEVLTAKQFLADRRHQHQPAGPFQQLEAALGFHSEGIASSKL